MGKVITVGNQKGGVGKTTTTGLIAWHLAKEARVLAVDMDMQGNLTQLLTQRENAEFEGRSMFNALEDSDATKYIIKAKPDDENQLYLLPAFDDLAFLQADQPEDYNKLKQALTPVIDDFDYILIDTPPSLGPHLVTSMMASDYVICLTLTHPMVVDATFRFLNRFVEIQKYNPSIELLGVVLTIFEQTSKNKAIGEKFRETLEDLVFDTEILKRNYMTDLVIKGISDKYAEDRKALQYYKNLAEEVKFRVNN